LPTTFGRAADLEEMMPDQAVCIAALFFVCDTFDSECALDATDLSHFGLCRQVVIGDPSPPSAPTRSLPGFFPRPRCPIDAPLMRHHATLLRHLVRSNVRWAASVNERQRNSEMRRIESNLCMAGT
jgi:hypothetical protein